MINNNVYYDKKFKRFIQVRQPIRDGWICGGLCKYYDDAITNIQSIRISGEHINKNFLKVDFIDECQFAKFDGIGWRVIEE